MHHPVGDITVIGKEQQSFGVAIEASDRVDPLGDMHQIHHRSSIAFVFGGGDVPTRLVEDQIARSLNANEISVDSDHRLAGVGARTEFGDDNPVNGNPTGKDHGFGGAARSHAARGENALQTFHGKCSDATSR